MLIDYHLHNHFSPDSEESTEKIIKKAIKMGMHEICITNHAELHDKMTGKSIFNRNEARERFRRIKSEIDELQPRFPGIRIALGVELEYVAGRMDQLADFVKETDLDFVLGSVHIVKDVIISSHLFADELYRKTDEKTAYHAYFDNLEKLVDWGHFDVAAHFDICKKSGYKFYGPFQPEKYRDRILPILKVMKQKKMGLELNTKCLCNKCRELFPHPTILKWALETGIENFTLSSDAHKEKHVSAHIKDALRIAKEVGIKNIATYSKRIPTLHQI